MNEVYCQFIHPSLPLSFKTCIATLLLSNGKKTIYLYITMRRRYEDHHTFDIISTIDYIIVIFCTDTKIRVLIVIIDGKCVASIIVAAVLLCVMRRLRCNKIKIRILSQNNERRKNISSPV